MADAVILGQIDDVLLAYVGLYPIVTAARWVAGAVLFRWLDEDIEEARGDDDLPGVTMLIPAYNEALVIAGAVHAAREADYPELEILVLDDGSSDDTAAVAREAAGEDPRVRVVEDPVNRGKADRLNLGFAAARHELVVVIDADTHLHPQAVRRLATRMATSPRLAAVAGSPHVTNRQTVLTGLQTLEFASIVGLIRRTEALTGRVGTVAGVLGMFRREAVLGVGGYQGRMATEDIDLSWRLLIAGWETSFEPRAIVGMHAPHRLSPLWAQRQRWARGQGQVLHTHVRSIACWRQRRLWPLALEACSSLAWVLLAVLALALAVLSAAVADGPSLLGYGIAWGIAIAVIATLQVFAAMVLYVRYDPAAPMTLFLGPLYPIAYWTIGALAALRSEAPALVRAPTERAVVWDVPREE